MLLMPANDIDFKAFASTVVDEHERTGKGIEDCLVEAAEKRKLTPEEIRRLVEKTNTELALRHLRGADKKDTFALASYDQVMKRIYVNEEADAKSDADGVEKTASLPNTRTKPIEDIPLSLGGQVKVAEQQVVNSSDFFQLRKQYEAAKLEKMAIENRLNGNLRWLEQAFRGREAPDLNKFASDATALLGNSAALVGMHLAVALGKDGLQKEAASQFVDDTTEHMQRMRAVCEDMQALLKQAALVLDYEKVIAAGKEALRKFANVPAEQPQPQPQPTAQLDTPDAPTAAKQSKLSKPVSRALFGLNALGTVAGVASNAMENLDKLDTIPQRYF